MVSDSEAVSTLDTPHVHHWTNTIYTLTASGNLEPEINVVFLDCGRKLEDLERTPHTHTLVEHANFAWNGPRRKAHFSEHCTTLKTENVQPEGDFTLMATCVFCV